MRIFAKETGRMEYKFDKVTLVPTNVYRDTYDEIAADFLTHYGCAQYLMTPMPIPIFEIACKRMELTVRTSQQLSENGDVLGTIAFFDGDVEVYDPGTKIYIAYAVNRATVLIDRTIESKGRANNTMAHEYVHWYIHRHYFDLLHKKVESAGIAFRCPTRISDGDEATQDEEWMEKQARGVAPRILMPKIATKKKLQDIIEMRGYRDSMENRLGVLTEIVDELAVFSMCRSNRRNIAWWIWAF
jgi:hypothetical protein